MKFTVDCLLTDQLLGLSQTHALARILSKARIEQRQMPLEALVCERYGLKAAPDYPIAPIAASADGLAVGDAFWLRADPVHLALQRDSFSLSAPVPLPLAHAHAVSVVASLNQHFSQDGLSFHIGNSGAWYLRLDQTPQIKTTLPEAAVGRSVYPFMPQGMAAATWVSYLNEVQMLLHSHAVNAEREAQGEFAVNSIWLSGGGVMPESPSPAPLSSAPHGDVDLIMADSAFYQGLANWSGIKCQGVPESAADMLLELTPRQHVYMELPSQPNFADTGFQVLWDALKSRRITCLTVNIGCYEKTLTATIRPLDTYKFWRKDKPIVTLLHDNN